jgi:hypothetical protein
MVMMIVYGRRFLGIRYHMYRFRIRFLIDIFLEGKIYFNDMVIYRKVIKDKGLAMI